MGIDIYASWHGQSDDEINRQHEVWFKTDEGRAGYLREAYHGEPYATVHLCAEAFQSDEAVPIPAATLRRRLPYALVLAGERARTLYHADPAAVEVAKQSFRDFVALCEQKEKETGEPVQIYAWR